MKYVVRRSEVRLLGHLWGGGVAATTRAMSAYDVGNAKDDDGKLTRESVGAWIYTHVGDFSEIVDFEADIEDGLESVLLPWSNPDSEPTFYDAMYGHEA